MKADQLIAISPIDGRYADQLQPLAPIWSELGLMHHRLLIEVRWLQTLASHTAIKEIPPLSGTANRQLKMLLDRFSEKEAKQIKMIEKRIHHDVKAVEIYLSRMKSLSSVHEFIHFGCTSDDINNLAYALMIKRSRDTILLPTLKKIITQLQKLAHQNANIPMLARTHGQPATPTTLGKEFANFVARLKEAYQELKKIKIKGKFNGATGNYNAHLFAYPDVNWEKLNKQFVEKLGLTWNGYTTQIEPHDYILELSHVLLHINTILIDLSRDIWTYISLGYFKQHTQKAHVGSSTMPHKINPIQFENAEGNCGLANALFEFFARKLPISRLQRDLTDSTVLRNIGVSFSHTLLAYQSLEKGLATLTPNETFMLEELNTHWELLAEPLQTLMRRYKIPSPYEKVKHLTRGKVIDQKTLHDFVDTLKLPQQEKERFKKLTPATYIGKAAQLAKKV